jgi:hypothetical protein
VLLLPQPLTVNVSPSRLAVPPVARFWMTCERDAVDKSMTKAKAMTQGRDWTAMLGVLTGNGTRRSEGSTPVLDCRAL